MPIPDEHLSPIDEPGLDGSSVADTDENVTDLGEEAEISFERAGVERPDEQDDDDDDDQADGLGTGGFGYGDPTD